MLKINKEIVTNLRQRFVTLQDVAYLYCAVHAEDWGVTVEPNDLNRLIALGYIDKATLSPTDEAVLLISIVTGEEEDVELKSFEDFWHSYPISDHWGNFPKTRDIRTRRDDALSEYRILVKSGITATEIKSGLLAYISQLKNKSAFGNAMKYMVGPYRFLKERLFRQTFQEDTEVYDKITS